MMILTLFVTENSFGIVASRINSWEQMRARRTVTLADTWIC